MSGLDGVDLSTSVACNVLKAPCRDNSIVGLKKKPKRQNVKRNPGKMDVGKVLKRIEDILREYHDCTFSYMATAKNVQILHANELFRSCNATMNPKLSTGQVTKAILEAIRPPKQDKMVD